MIRSCWLYNILIKYRCFAYDIVMMYCVSRRHSWGRRHARSPVGMMYGIGRCHLGSFAACRVRSPATTHTCLNRLKNISKFYIVFPNGQNRIIFYIFYCSMVLIIVQLYICMCVTYIYNYLSLILLIINLYLIQLHPMFQDAEF